MAFTWNEQTISVTKEYIVEVRNKIDSIDSNIACLTNKVTYYNGHLSGYLGTKYTTNNATQYVTHKTSYDSGYDNSNRNSYDSGHKSRHKGSHYGSQVINDYSSYDTTHRFTVYTVD